MRLEHARWPELAGLAARIFVVPLGSMEQHGHHLPLATDSLIVSRIAESAGQLLPGRVALLPVQWLGHSPHHSHFGCLSLDVVPYLELLRGLCRSLVKMGARKILLLNGHGGNEVPAKAALRELKTEFAAQRDLYIALASYWDLAAPEFATIRESPPGGMGHACEMETSVMLALNPELVLPGAARRGGPPPESGRTIDMQKPRPYYLVNDFDELSDNGVIGMPEFATADKGMRFFDAAVAGVVRFLEEMESWRFQERPPAPGVE